MKVTIFSSNQPRHLNIAKEFSKICDSVFLVSEVNTVFPGQVNDFYKKSEIMQTYFQNVIQSERNIFGEPLPELKEARGMTDEQVIRFRKRCMYFCMPPESGMTNW